MSAAGEVEPLIVELELYLDDHPPHGRVRTADGAEERFVGWLGFVGALTQLRAVSGCCRTAAGRTGRG